MVLGRLSSLSPYRFGLLGLLELGWLRSPIHLQKIENYRELIQGKTLKTVSEQDHPEKFFLMSHKM
jgi:hypothetical protein